MQAQLRNNHRGFTFIELIIVITIIGILAIGIAPRFFGTSDTQVFDYRDQALALLRRIQIQSMQCTQNATAPSICPIILNVSANHLGTNATCTDDSTNMCIDGKYAINMAAAYSTLSFDAFGRPVNCGNNGTSCLIQFNSVINPTPGICIEDEGYIRPC